MKQYKLFRALVCFGLVLVAAFSVSGCATLEKGFQSPTVLVQNIRPIQGNGLSPKLRLDLLVQNPNAFDIALDGMSYTIKIDNFDVLSGVASQLPAIVAYGKTPVTVDIDVNIVSFFKLAQSFIQTPGNSISYSLEAKFNPSGFFPRFTVSDSGDISLNNRK